MNLPPYFMWLRRRRAAEIRSTDPAAYWENRARTRGPIAGDYQDPVLREFETPLRKRALFASIPWNDGLHILDIGTGTGTWALEFWRRGASVVGIDISPAMIATARSLAAQDAASIRYEVGAVQDLPGEFERRFDLITSITVLQHLLHDSELQRALAKCAMALNDSGRLVCMEHTGGYSLRRNTYMRFRSRSAWVWHFRAAGFAIEHIVAVRRVPVVLLLYRLYARLRWPSGPPGALTSDGRAWCGVLRATHAVLNRLLPARTGSDLTLFVLRQR